jgi:hypothetical protein
MESRNARASRHLQRAQELLYSQSFGGPRKHNPYGRRKIKDTDDADVLTITSENDMFSYDVTLKLILIADDNCMRAKTITKTVYFKNNKKTAEAVFESPLVVLLCPTYDDRKVRVTRAKSPLFGIEIWTLNKSFKDTYELLEKKHNSNYVNSLRHQTDVPELCESFKDLKSSGDGTRSDEVVTSLERLSMV